MLDLYKFNCENPQSMILCPSVGHWNIQKQKMENQMQTQNKNKGEDREVAPNLTSHPGFPPHPHSSTARRASSNQPSTSTDVATGQQDLSPEEFYYANLILIFVRAMENEMRLNIETLRTDNARLTRVVEEQTTSESKRASANLKCLL